MFIALPKQAQDLTGKRYGLWAVLGPVEIKRYVGSTTVMWLCRCDCGNEVGVSAGSLRRGLSKSCGCERNTQTSIRRTTHGHSSGGVKTPEYQTWARIKTRCTNENHSDYPDYGGRGLMVAAEWVDDFEAFYAHIGPKPTSKHSIDRIDNERGYEPGNVRWATTEVQSNNKRSNHSLTVGDQTMTIRQWAQKTGLDQKTICMRVLRGWSAEDAVSKPAVAPQPTAITANGKTMSIPQWAKELGISAGSIHGRIHRGWSPERAVTQSIRRR